MTDESEPERDRPVTREREREIRELLNTAAKSRIHLAPPEKLRDLVDAARDLRDLLDWERTRHQ